jgi:hypothetical protein
MDAVSVAGEDAGLPRLDGFFSQKPEEAAEFLESHDLGPVDLATLPKEQWFPAKEGIDLIDRYLTLIDGYEYMSRDQIPLVLEDLGAMRSILALLESKGLGWHLGIDI